MLRRQLTFQPPFFQHFFTWLVLNWSALFLPARLRSEIYDANMDLASITARCQYGPERAQDSIRSSYLSRPLV